MSDIIFLTRAYPPSSGSGGALQRQALVKILEKNGHRVSVILTERENPTFISRLIKKIFVNLEKIGLVANYTGESIDAVKARVCNAEHTHVFSTSGGELHTIVLGARLAKSMGLKHIVNLRDPLLNSVLVKNSSMCWFWRRGIRHKKILKVIRDADGVVCSGTSLTKRLLAEVPDCGSKLKSVYFGYPGPPISSVRRGRPTLIYGGNLGRVQGIGGFIDDFIKANTQISHREAMKLELFGNGFEGRIFGSNVTSYPLCTRAQYYEVLKSRRIIGVVSLADKSRADCIPGKLFEFIKFGIPVLAYMPEGECASLVTDLEIGRVIMRGKVPELVDALTELSDEAMYERYVNNIKKIQDDFQMERASGLIIKLLEN